MSVCRSISQTNVTAQFSFVMGYYSNEMPVPEISLCLPLTLQHCPHAETAQSRNAVFELKTFTTAFVYAT
jgi:hypothetical protein